MGVFEQQHCNYEHLFGQALLVDPHVDMGTEGRKGRETLTGQWFQLACRHRAISGQQQNLRRWAYE